MLRLRIVGLFLSNIFTLKTLVLVARSRGGWLFQRVIYDQWLRGGRFLSTLSLRVESSVLDGAVIRVAYLHARRRVQSRAWI